MMSDQNENQTLPHCSFLKKSKTFKCAKHADQTSKKLQRFYENKELFDVVVIAGVDSVRVPAHRIVLSAWSDYFLAKSCNNLHEPEADEVRLKDIDGITMKSIIDFMYTAIIELNCDTIESILIAADFLQMDALIDACCDFMEEQLDASNCLGIALIADQHGYAELHKKAFLFAYKNFEKLYTEKEFAQLEEAQLHKFISSDDLGTHSEETVFRSLVGWVEYDRENREKSTLSLLSHVRFTLLNPKFIIENRHSVCRSMKCYELICSWLEWHLSPESRSQFPTVVNTKSRKAKQRLAFAKGETTNNLKVKTLDPKLNTWSYEELPSSSKCKFDYTTTVINNKMIISGGKIDGVVTNSIECLDLQTKQWTELAPMGCARMSHALAELRGNLYVLGGRNNSGWLCSVEKYDFSTNAWQTMAPLYSTFENIKVAAGDGALYAVGCNSNVIEYFDLVANKWVQTPSKNEQFINFGIAAVGGYLYAVGGSKNENRSKTIERFDPLTKTWTFVSSLKTERRSVRCVSLNDRLIVCGGTSNNGWVGLVEEYNPENNKWSTFAPLPLDEVDYYKNVSSLFTI